MALQSHSNSSPSPLRIGSVSFLNAKPLLYGLDALPNIQLLLDVPSRLLQGLHQGRFDIALLPIIDYQRLDNLLLVPGGGIGSDGTTLTVRIFSRVPIPQITTLACDTDSHTSVALARVIFAERFRIHPEFVNLDAAHPDTHARLLIGDKVVCEEPPDFPHQLDLGAAWKDLTGLPFVFAAWMSPRGLDLGDLPLRLEHAKRQGLQHLPQIIEQFAIPRGWPPDLALQYMQTYLKYDISYAPDSPQLKAITLFHHLAARHNILPAPLRPLRPLQIYPSQM